MQSLKLILKLVLRQTAIHPGRAIVTVFGIIASTCAVVWVVSGYDALVSQFDENAGKYLGRYDILLIPQGQPGAVSYVDPKVIEMMREDPGVLELNPVHQSRVSIARVSKPGEGTDESSLGLLIGTRPPVNGAPPIDPVLVGTAAEEPPYELQQGAWLKDDSVVISSGAAKRLNITVGDEVLVTTMANQMRLPVIGVVEQAPETPSLGGGPGGRGNRSGGRGSGRGGPGGGGPGRGGQGGGRGAGPGPTEGTVADRADSVENTATKLGIPAAFVQGVATNAIYVRPQLAEKINGFSSEPTVLQVALRDSYVVYQFSSKWKEPLAAALPAMTIVDFSTVRAGLTNSMSVSSQRSQSYAATGFASLASVFIIFSLLSMGVSERTREFALLRAVAFSRLQIAGVVGIESFILAAIGWFCGLVLGFCLLFIGSRWMPGLFASGATLGWTTFKLTAATVLLGAIGAAVLPAWRATRIRPLEAISVSRVAAPGTWHYSTMTVVGLLLAITAPVTVFLLPLPDQWRVWCYSMVTYPALLIGMVLLTPIVVRLSERLFGSPLSKLFGIDPRLFHTQLSTNLWRTIGATLALSVGLGLYASTQTWGFSMLKPFMPGDWLPDMLVSFQPGGLDDQGLDAVRKAEGVENSSVTPLAIEQAKFDWGDDEAPGRITHDNAVLFGIDAQEILTGNAPLVPVNFVQGNRDDVVSRLKSGGTCVVSRDFQVTSGLRVGQKVKFIPPNAPSQRVEYEIVGVVEMPGWQWITKFSGVRRHFVRTASMMFVDRQTVRKDFQLNRTEFCWLNLKPGTKLPEIEAAMQKIAEQFATGNIQADGLGTVTSYRPFARATATETVRRSITIRAKDMIWGMSQLPLITLFIMSLAVVNAVIASVRSRQWEFGILRSIGTTRLQLVKIVIAETLLIGLSACMLSLSFGLIAGWCGVGMALYGNWGQYFGTPEFLVPWQQLGFGFVITLSLCAIAAAWPAFRIGRAEPLSLLAAGRSAR
ncbi:FtsX-like permease family protein [Pirellula sp. SH-Sr6A]|uniref:FtsX-like permease family protein n=1 Tax=Pirellula sp. SH-Sr6A TaxID=1632865 RepID=UPI00078B3759|nr:FtsX-like permease family protein [Pirellula sp. SH-Sr6A]AMV31547.1 FtsX-like permease family protein [Pirellula sp. SH-Sr6A]